MATESSTAGSSSHASSGMSIEKLKGIVNYSSWKFMMRMILIHDELWDYVESDNKGTTAQKQKALAKIALSVTPAAIPHIRKAESAHEAWSNLQKAYEDKGLSRRLGLLRMLFAMKLSECESMEAYVNKITEISQQLSEIGSALEDDFVAVVMLSGLSSDYDPMIMALENSNVKLSSEVVKGKLLHENLRRDEKSDGVSALVAQKKPRCFRCKKVGHMIKDCPKPGNKINPKPSKDKILLTALSANIKRDLWYIDSGATAHMCGDLSVMSDYVSGKRLDVSLADGNKLCTAGKGSVKVILGDNRVKTIGDVFYVPKLTTNLLSVSAMIDKGYDVIFGSSGCQISNDGVVVATGTLRNGIFQLDTSKCSLIACNIAEKDTSSFAGSESAVPLPVSTGMEPSSSHGKSAVAAESVAVPDAATVKNVAAATTCTQGVWHRRLAHLNHRSMELLKRGMVDGISYNSSSMTPCIPCVEGKQTRTSFPKKSFTRAKDILELVHSDLCGPMPCKSLGGSRYFMTFLDDFTRETFVYFLKSKGEAFEKFKIWKALVENQTNKKLKAIRSDNGGEYMSAKFQSFLRDNGILHQTTVPYSPQQNGVAERANRSILERARCMLLEAGLDQSYWAEAVNTAVYLKNRSPTIAVKGCTPEQKWTNKKVSVSHLRIFGCVAYAHKHTMTKLEARAKQCIFVGYCENTKGYRLVDPSNPTIYIKARDVTFLEDKCYKDIESHDDNSSVVVFTPPVCVNNTQTPAASSSQYSDDTVLMQNNQQNSMVTADDSESEVESPESNDTSDETYIPEDSLEEDSTEYSDCSDESLLANLAREIDSDGDEPQTVQEALSSPDADNWQLAMQDEYKSFLVNKCWTLTDRVEQKPIKCKWVFKKKRGVNGELLKYKARLVAKGFTQRQGVDYHETFSPVVRFSSIRALLAIAAEYNMDIDHLDVKTAFLNGDLQENVYMEQPDGFVTKGKEDKVYKLNKAIYGLKQSAKAWYEKINHVLCEKLGFTKCLSEPCVFFKSGDTGLVIIALYVDDILLFSFLNSSEKAKIKEKLNSEFEITDLGPASHVLGMKLSKLKDEIKLDQSHFIERLLCKFKMEECKPSPTPMEVGVKLTKAEKSSDSHNYDYRSLIGSLMYIAVGTRPDIAHAVSYLSQFNSCYDVSHWKVAKRVLRYLKGTQHLCLTFAKGGMAINAFADADWGRNETDRRSYTGYVFKVGKSVVSWESRKQRTVALSSTEAEYMALSDTCKEALFLQKFLREILGRTFKTTIFNDNQSAQKMCSNSMFHARTKHIDIRHHFIRENVSNGVIDVKYLCTSDMIADVLTKPLSRDVHNKFIAQLMLV